VTVGDETRRAIAKGLSPRAAFIVDLAEHVKVFALGGDVEAVHVAADALARTIGMVASTERTSRMRRRAVAPR
jgi:hypothetical protein